MTSFIDFEHTQNEFFSRITIRCCALWFINGKTRFGVILWYHSVENSWILYHSDFTWNQFGDSRSAKSAILTYLEALKLDYYEILHFLKAEIYQINKIQSPRNCKNSNLWNYYRVSQDQIFLNQFALALYLNIFLNKLVLPTFQLVKIGFQKA